MMGDLAKWQCHKGVAAGKILRLPILLQNERGEATGRWSLRVEGADGNGTTIECPNEVFARKQPSVGDYLVIYKDGYISWSPAHAFEDGYTRIPDAPPTDGALAGAETFPNTGL